jgi:hypothetical protein
MSPSPEVPEQPADGPAHVDDVDHQRQAELLGRLAGEPQRRPGIVADHLVPQPHLHADDHVGMLAGPRDGLLRRSPPEVLELAHEPADHPLHRDVEEGEHPRLRALDDVAAEAGEGLGARRAGVDGGGDPAPQAVRVRVDAVVRDALVQVRVQVDQAGHQHQVAGVDRLGGRPVRTRPGQAAAGDGDIETAVDSPRRIDDPASGQDQDRSRQQRGREAPQGRGEGRHGPFDVLLGMSGAEEAGPVEELHTLEQHPVVQLGRQLRAHPGGLERLHARLLRRAVADQQVEGRALPVRPPRYPRFGQG